MQKTNLIIGASSKVGLNISNELEKNSILTYNTNKIKNAKKFNIEIDDISNAFDLKLFKNCIILSAISDPNLCFNNIKYSDKINVECTINLINKLINNNIKIFFISTEFVYNGNNKFNKEVDKTFPILVYGQQKKIVEDYIIKNTDNYCIFRLSKSYSVTKFKYGLIYDWYNKYQQGLFEDNCADDQFFSPLEISDLYKVLDKCIAENINGIFNLGGPERMSRYECLKYFYKCFNINKEIIKISIDDVILPEKRPKDVSLNIDKIVNIIDFKLITFEQSLLNFRNEISK